MCSDRVEREAWNTRRKSTKCGGGRRLACGTGGAGTGDLDTLLVQVVFDEVGHDGCVSNKNEEGEVREDRGGVGNECNERRKKE